MKDKTNSPQRKLPSWMERRHNKDDQSEEKKKTKKSKPAEIIRKGNSSRGARKNNIDDLRQFIDILGDFDEDWSTSDIQTELKKYTCEQMRNVLKENEKFPPTKFKKDGMFLWFIKRHSELIDYFVEELYVLPRSSPRKRAQHQKEKMKIKAMFSKARTKLDFEESDEEIPLERKSKRVEQSLDSSVETPCVSQDTCSSQSDDSERFDWKSIPQWKKRVGDSVLVSANPLQVDLCEDPFGLIDPNNYDPREHSWVPCQDLKLYLEQSQPSVKGKKESRSVKKRNQPPKPKPIEQEVETSSVIVQNGSESINLSPNLVKEIEEFRSPSHFLSPPSKAVKRPSPSPLSPSLTSPSTALDNLVSKYLGSGVKKDPSPNMFQELFPPLKKKSKPVVPLTFDSEGEEEEQKPKLKKEVKDIKETKKEKPKESVPPKTPPKRRLSLKVPSEASKPKESTSVAPKKLLPKKSEDEFDFYSVSPSLSPTPVFLSPPNTQRSKLNWRRKSKESPRILLSTFEEDEAEVARKIKAERKQDQLLCPLCSKKIPTDENEDPNDAVSRHMDSCPGYSSPSAPQKTKGKTAKAKVSSQRKDKFLSPPSSSGSSPSSSSSASPASSLSPSTPSNFSWALPKVARKKK